MIKILPKTWKRAEISCYENSDHPDIFIQRLCTGY